MSDFNLLKTIHRLSLEMDAVNPVGVPVFIEKLEKETGLNNTLLKSKLQPLFQAGLIKGDISGIWVSLEKNAVAALSNL